MTMKGWEMRNNGDKQGDNNTTVGVKDEDGGRVKDEDRGAAVGGMTTGDKRMTNTMGMGPQHNRDNRQGGCRRALQP